MHEEYLASLNADNICKVDMLYYLFAIDDPVERQNLKADMLNLARKFGQTRMFNASLKIAAQEIAKRNRGSAEGKKTHFTDQPVQLWCGEWECDDTGVRAPVASKYGDDVEYQYACTVPIMPVELLANDDTDTERVRLAYAIDGEWRYITVDRLTISSNSRIVELSNASIGVTSENARLLVRYLSDMIAGNDLPRLPAVSRLGWLDDAFIPYTDAVRFDGEAENRDLFNAVSAVGSRERWIERMKDMMEDSLLFRLTMAASLASPIISRVHALPFVWHLWGGTSSGKTVAMMCAMSAWGDPRLGALCRTLNMTPNSMMTTAAFLHNLPFAGDELQIIKDKFGSYDKLIMAITEGVDRGRMKYNKNEKLKTWSCAFLTTGEDPVTNYASGGGVINRVIEAECTEKLVADGNGTIEFIKSNHGLIGEEYIRLLNDSGRDLQKIYNSFYAAVLEKMPETTEKKAQTAALLLSADLIAAQDIFGIEPLRVVDILPLLKSADEVSVAERAHTFIMDAIATNANRFYGTGGDEDNHGGEVWGRCGTFEAYINKTILCRILRDQGFEFESVKREWAAKGYLRLSSQGRYVHQTKVAGVKANYVCLTLPEAM